MPPRGPPPIPHPDPQRVLQERGVNTAQLLTKYKEAQADLMEREKMLEKAHTETEKKGKLLSQVLQEKKGLKADLEAVRKELRGVDARLARLETLQPHQPPAAAGAAAAAGGKGEDAELRRMVAALQQQMEEQRRLIAQLTALVGHQSGLHPPGANAARTAPAATPMDDAKARAVAILRGMTPLPPSPATKPATATATAAKGRPPVPPPTGPPAKRQRRKAADAADGVGLPKRMDDLSLALSANLAAAEAGEEPTPADLVALHVKGLSNTGKVPIDELGVAAAADALTILVTQRGCPVELVVAGFETAILDCAAPAPQPLPGPGAAPIPNPQSWFGIRRCSKQQVDKAGGSTQPYLVVWCKREALEGSFLPWLLRRAAAVDSKLSADVDAGKHALKRPTLLEMLRTRLHSLVAQSCSAAAPTHAETELCAAAVGAAALCLIQGDVLAMRALVLDLLTCGVASAPAILPPLAAAVEVWPEAFEGGNELGDALRSAIMALALETAGGSALHHPLGVEAGGPAQLVEGVKWRHDALAAAAIVLLEVGRQHWNAAKGAPLLPATEQLERLRRCIE
jgi:hypothetical protein